MTNEPKSNDNTKLTKQLVSVDVEKKIDHLYDLIVVQKVLEREKYSVWNKYISLGMAYQAFIVAGLTQLQLINPTPGQQCLAGLMFLGLYFYHLSIEKRKIL